MSMFFAHPSSIEYLRYFPMVLILDCTYNTNSAEMPLFETIGITPCRKSFCVSFEFVPGEGEDDYIQALRHSREMLGADAESGGVFLIDKSRALRNALAIVFPEWTVLLCVWHVNKQVSAKCKKSFDKNSEWQEFNQGWTQIVQSRTEEEYKANVKEWRDKWIDSHPADVSYIERNWLIEEVRDMVVSAWTDQHLHLDTNVTSRGEGIHSTIKADIMRKVDMLYGWEAIDKVVMRQVKAIDHEQKRQRVAAQAQWGNRVFDEVRRYVSHDALNRTVQQLRLARDPEVSLRDCTGVYTKSLGLPCKHTIESRLGVEPLRLTDFDPSWHLRIFGEGERPRPILPPLKAAGPGTRRARTNGSASSTRRLPSEFELAAKEKAQRTAYEKGIALMRCSVCSPEERWGHRKNMLACPQHPRHRVWLLENGEISNDDDIDTNDNDEGIRSSQRSSPTLAQRRATQKQALPAERLPTRKLPFTTRRRSNNRVSLEGLSPDPLQADDDEPIITKQPPSRRRNEPETIIIDSDANSSQNSDVIIVDRSDQPDDTTYDPELELDQYMDREEVTSTGFKKLVQGKDIAELPPEK
jgi:hypothetical protein